MSQGDHPLPITLRAVIALLLLEALGALALAGLGGYVSWAEHPGHLWDRVTLPFEVLAVVSALVLTALGWQLSHRRAWARGPVVALELVLVPVAYYVIQAGGFWVGIPAIAVALACIGLLIAPTSRAALGIR